MSEFIGLLIAGIVTGSIYAVSASGLVVTYNTTGIFNVAYGAMGMVLAYLFWQLWQGWNLPAVVALVLVLFVAAPLMGAVVERVVMRPLYGASANIRLSVTLGLFLVLVALANVIWNQSNSYNVPQFFSGDQVSVGGVNLSYEQILTVLVAVAMAVLLRLFFKRTRTGVAMRAVVDNPSLASLAGAPSGRISSYAWMIGVMFAALAGILDAPTVANMNIILLAELVIYGYAAAVVGRLRSLPMTFLGAMILGIAQSMAVGYAPSSVETDVVEALPMAMLFIALLLVPEVRLSIGRVARIRPPQVASLRTSMVGAGVVLVGTVALSMVLTGSSLFTLGNAIVLSILALSLIPLSGYGGQISLCQFSFLGLGAITMHWVGGGNSWLGVLAAIGMCAAWGVVLALPILRLRGIYMALATLAFAVLMDLVFFASTSIMGIGGTVAVGRPGLFGLNFSSDRSFDIVLAVVLGLCLVGVGALRRGPFGRRLVAMSDSPAACATVGLRLTVTKLAVFSLSAGMAGLAGALYGSLNTEVGAGQFAFLYSIALFVSVTLAGANLMTGAVLAGCFIAIGPVIGAHIPQIPDFTQLLVGVGVIAIGRNPNGIGKLYTDVAYFMERRRARVGLAPAASATASANGAPPAAAWPAATPPRPSMRQCTPLADLNVSRVSVRFGGVQALRDVDLTVPPGCVHGLIGPNGAGKTTMFNVITGMEKPNSGHISYGGLDISGAAPHIRSRLGIARTFQRLELFGTLTTRENVRMAAETQRRRLPPNTTSGALADALMERVGITHVANEPADMLPTGLARLVELARALATAPSMLLLDEPGAGLNSDETANLGRILRQLAGHGMGILLVEHDMSLVMGVCHTITVLDFGVVVANGDPAAVQSNPAVQAAYLGDAQQNGHGAMPASGAPAGSPRVVLSAPAPNGAAAHGEVAPGVAATNGAPTSNGAHTGGAAAALLELDDVRAGYGRIEVLHGVSLQVPEGSILALLGPNGAGKSTLLKAASGRLTQNSGAVRYQGQSIKGILPENLAHKGLCSLPEGRAVFPNLTVGENLLMWTYPGVSLDDVHSAAFARFPVLAQRRQQLAGTLSGGEQQMLALARVLVSKPKLLLLDEISMGLAPLVVTELYEVVRSLANEGITVVLAEQFVHAALSVATTAAIVVQGRIDKIGEPGEIGAAALDSYLAADAGPAR